MPGRVYPRAGSPLSRAELQRSGFYSSRQEFLDFYATSDVIHIFDDFTGKAIDTTNNWTAAAGAGATTWAIAAAANGTIAGVGGGTAATSGLQLIGVPTFAGTQHPGIEVRYKVGAAATDLRVEIGFANAAPAVNTTIVNSITTPTFNTVTTAAVYMWDNASAADTMGLYTIGSGGVTAKKVAGGTAPTAAVYQRVRVEVHGGSANAWVDGVLVASQPLAITAADTMVPLISTKDAGATTKTITLDYVRIYGVRV